MHPDRKTHHLMLTTQTESAIDNSMNDALVLCRRKIASQKTLARELLRMFFKVRVKSKLFWISPIWGLVLLLIMFGTTARHPDAKADRSPTIYSDFQDVNDSQTRVRTAFRRWLYTPNNDETLEKLELLIGDVSNATGCETVDEMRTMVEDAVWPGEGHWAGFELRDGNETFLYHDMLMPNTRWVRHVMVLSCPQITDGSINVTHANFADIGGWMVWSRALVALELTMYLSFIVMFPAYHMIEFRTLKISLLMTMNGAREFLVCVMFIVADLLSIIPWGIIGGIVLAFSKNGHGASPVLILFYILLQTLVYYAICVCFSAMSRNAIMFLLWFCVLLFFSGFFPFFELALNEWMHVSVFYVISFFFPMLNMALFVGNMATMQHLSSFTFNNAMYGYYLPTSELFGLLIASLAFYGFLAFVGLVLSSPAVQGQTGWRRIFHKGFWKRISISDEELSAIPAKMPFISAEGMSKTYVSSHRQTKALNGVSFTLKKGESILLIGPNGCGKTTLIHSLIGAVKVDSGEIAVGDHPMSTNFAQLQDFMGFCFQENVHFHSLSVRDHLRFFAALRGFKGREINDQIEHLAESLRLTEFLDSKAGVLSGGQKRKLGVAMALIGQPPLIFLDEPTVGVDIATRQIIWKTLGMFTDSTVFIASHSLEEAECISDRLFVMQQGSILFQGSSEELRRKFKCGYMFKVTGDDIDMEKVLEFIQVRIPGAELSTDRPDVIMIPYGKNLHDLLVRMQVAKDALGIDNYTLTAQKLEDVIVLFIESSENLNDL